MNKKKEGYGKGVRGVREGRVRERGRERDREGGRERVDHEMCTGSKLPIFFIK